MKVIVNADDFGVSFGVNDAVEAAFRAGTLTSASIRTNGVQFSDAVEKTKTSLKKIGLGLHLNLTDGRTHTAEIANNKHEYKHSFFSYFLRLLGGDRKLLTQIEAELRAQFEIAKEQGLKLDHVDGQDHIHMIPEIFALVCRLCNEYNVKAIRISDEPLFIVGNRDTVTQSIQQLGVIKNRLLHSFASANKATARKHHLISTDAYFGVLYTSSITTQVFEQAIKSAKSHGYSSIEVALHPGISHYKKDTKHTSAFFKKYENMRARDVERETLLSSEVQECLQGVGIQTSTFAHLLK